MRRAEWLRQAWEQLLEMYLTLTRMREEYVVRFRVRGYEAYRGYEGARLEDREEELLKRWEGALEGLKMLLETIDRLAKWLEDSGIEN